MVKLTKINRNRQKLLRNPHFLTYVYVYQNRLIPTPHRHLWQNLSKILSNVSSWLLCCLCTSVCIVSLSRKRAAPPIMGINLTPLTSGPPHNSVGSSSHSGPMDTKYQGFPFSDFLWGDAPHDKGGQIFDQFLHRGVNLENLPWSLPLGKTLSTAVVLQYFPASLLLTISHSVF